MTVQRQTKGSLVGFSFKYVQQCKYTVSKRANLQPERLVKMVDFKEIPNCHFINCLDVSVIDCVSQELMPFANEYRSQALLPGEHSAEDCKTNSPLWSTVRH